MSKFVIKIHAEPLYICVKILAFSPPNELCNTQLVKYHISTWVVMLYTQMEETPHEFSHSNSWIFKVREQII